MVFCTITRVRNRKTGRQQKAFCCVFSTCIFALVLFNLQGIVLLTKCIFISTTGTGAVSTPAFDVTPSSVITTNPLSLLGNRSLPSFVNGGVMIFFHVAKNGGTSIRNMLNEFDNVEVSAWQGGFANWLPLLKKYVGGHGEPGKVKILEIHCGGDPTLPEMAQVIHNLRRRAAENAVPFFVFSTYREPLAYAVSFYNYENIGRGSMSKYEHGEPNEQDFMRISLPSPQCLFFARGELSTTVDYKYFGQNLTLQECRDTYQVMTQTIDWIGVVDDIQSETLPLLSFMLNGRQERGLSFPVQNKQRINAEKIDPENLSKTAVDHIRNITMADLEIFHRVQEDYPIDMWTNFRPLAAPVTKG